MKFRTHQQEAKNIASDIVAGVVDRKLTCAFVTPGGGKTALCSVFAHELLAGGAIDRVLVLCPRDSLRSQMVDGFKLDSAGLTRGLCIWDPKKSNRQLSIGNECGVVTTYQSAVAHMKRLWRLVEASRTLIVLDEVHHLAGADEDDEPSDDFLQWRKAVDPLVTAATHTLLMTGTLYRSDGCRIPYIHYGADEKPIAHIRYTRQDALDEGAVLPIEFRMWDGDSKFEYRGEEVETAISEAEGDDSKRALRTALLDPRPEEDGGYVSRFLRNFVDEWSNYRVSQYKSKAIVVCQSQTMARQLFERLREIGFDPALAISDESDSAKRIRKFRKTSDFDILVTVGMAYEGLDVPDATHIAILSNRRARPWLEQVVARVTRVNGNCIVDPDGQYAFVYIPNDRRACKFVDEMLSEQEQSVPLKERTKLSNVKPRGRSTFVPIKCDTTNRYEARDGHRYSAAESREIEWLRSSCPEFAHIPAKRLMEMSEIFRRRSAGA